MIDGAWYYAMRFFFIGDSIESTEFLWRCRYWLYGDYRKCGRDWCRIGIFGGMCRPGEVLHDYHQKSLII